MDRRSLFKHAVALFGIPSDLVGSALLAQAVVIPEPTSAPGPVPGTSPATPAWLEDWLRLPMRPVVDERDLEGCEDCRVRNLASRILARPGGDPLVFRYLGGSEPGRERSVLTVLLFRKFDPAVTNVDTESIEVASATIYLLAHCQIRGSARTFRLDRMELVLG